MRRFLPLWILAPVVGALAVAWLWSETDPVPRGPRSKDEARSSGALDVRPVESRTALPSRIEEVGPLASVTISVSGRVIDHGGAALSGATIMSDQGGQPVVLGVSGLDGSFAYELPKYRELSIRATLGTHGASEWAYLESDRERIEVLELVVRGTESLQGIVVGADGVRLSSRTVTITKFNEDHVHLTRLLSGALSMPLGHDGTFTFRGLEPGTYSTSVEGARERWLLESGETWHRLETGLVELRVDIEDEREFPLPGARLLVDDQSGGSWVSIADAQGRVTLRLNTGTYFLRATHEPYSACEVELTLEEGETLPASQTLTLHSEEGRGALSLRFVDVDGNPMAMAVGGLRSLEQPSKTVRILDLRRYGGFVDGIPPGAYRVSLVPGERTPWDLPVEAPVVIRAGLTTEMTLTFQRGGRLELDVILDVGEVESLVALLHHRNSGKRRQLDLVAPFSCQEILPPGDYEVRVLAQGFESKTENFEIRSGEITRARLALNRAVR